jgi:hypothetical protein
VDKQTMSYRASVEQVGQVRPEAWIVLACSVGTGLLFGLSGVPLIGLLWITLTAPGVLIAQRADLGYRDL